MHEGGRRANLAARITTPATVVVMPFTLAPWHTNSLGHTGVPVQYLTKKVDTWMHEEVRRQHQPCRWTLEGVPQTSRPRCQQGRAILLLSSRSSIKLLKSRALAWFNRAEGEEASRPVGRTDRRRAGQQQHSLLRPSSSSSHCSALSARVIKYCTFPIEVACSAGVPVRDYTTTVTAAHH